MKKRTAIDQMIFTCIHNTLMLGLGVRASIGKHYERRLTPNIGLEGVIYWEIYGK